MSEVMKMPCACMSARRLARVITRLYADEMSGVMEPTQFGLLQTIASMPDCTQAKLMRAAGYDRTTLSRDITRMKAKGWVTGGRGGVKVTQTGQLMLKITTPYWQNAQERLKDTVGETAWKALQELSLMVAEDVEDAA